MEVRLKHDTLDIEVFLTHTTPQGAQTLIQFITGTGVELDTGNVLEYKESKVMASSTESWLRIIVGAPEVV